MTHAITRHQPHVAPIIRAGRNGHAPPRAVEMLLRKLMANWTWGQLTLDLPDGSRRAANGTRAGHAAEMTVADYRFATRVFTRGDIGFAEGYVAGEWDSPDLAVLLEALADNYDHIRRLHEGDMANWAINWLGHQLNRNNRSGSRRNIHAHYDLGNAFYRAWLDPTMTYSSARFDHPGQPLAEAQIAKYRSIARMLNLHAGQSVLEIGCGWGGFAEFAAREIGALVTAVTISREQYEFASRRMFEAGLSERVDVRLVDYRDIGGQFDCVASIEMFEAVGREYWPTYFRKIHDLLKPGGRAGLQIITIQDALFDDYAARTDFIQKYIFPGGCLPSERKIAPIISRAGLTQIDVERFGRDYADTLAQWAQRFDAAWDEIRAQSPTFDERFRRLWRFYLAYCEAGFRSARTDVVQLALGRAA